MKNKYLLFDTITNIDELGRAGFTFWGPFGAESDRDDFVAIVRETFRLLKEPRPMGIVAVEEVPKECEIIKPEMFAGFDRRNQVLVSF